MKYVILQSLTYIIGVIYILLFTRKCSFWKRLVSAIVVAINITFFARVFWAIENWRYFSTGVYKISTLFELTIGNFKIIGVLIGALIATFILCKIFKNEARSIRNASVEAMFLTAGYTKLVCTIMGNCCLGKECSMPWAISYPKINLYNLHPTALYEVITWWTCFILLHVLKDKVKPDSSRISFAVFLYVATRFFIIEGLYATSVFMGNIRARVIYSTIILICIGIISFNTYKEKIENDNKRRYKMKQETIGAVHTHTHTDT